MKFIKGLYKTLKFQDYFYLIFTHEFKGEKKQHSYFSVFISFFINIICFIILIFNLLRLFLRKEPTISYAKIDLSKAINITLNSEQLLFSIFVRDKNHIPLNDPTIITVNPIYNILHRSENGKIISSNNVLDIVNCTNYKNIYKKINQEENFNGNDIALHYCFNFKNDIVIGGRYSDDFYASLAIYISKCQNSSDSNITCNSPEIINEKVQDAWLQIFYSTYSINSENFSNPISTDLTSVYFKLDNRLNKHIYTYYSSIDFTSNENFIFDQFINKNGIRLDHTFNDVNLINSKDQHLSIIYVCSAVTKEKIQRRYIKIQEVGANISGLLYVQCFIVYIFLYFPQLKLMDIEIINVIFDYRPKYLSYDEDVHNRRLSNYKKVKYRPIKIKNQIDINKKVSSSSLNNKKNINDNEIVQMKKLNTFDVLKIYLCWWNHKYKKLRDEMKFLMKEKIKYTDLAETLKNYIQIEKMKQIFIKKGLCDKDTFNFQKKLLRFDSLVGLKAYQGKISNNDIDKIQISPMKDKKNINKTNSHHKIDKNSSLIFLKEQS